MISLSDNENKMLFYCTKYSKQRAKMLKLQKLYIILNTNSNFTIAHRK